MSWAVKRAISNIPYGVRCEGIHEAPHDIKKAEALASAFWSRRAPRELTDQVRFPRPGEPAWDQAWPVFHSDWGPEAVAAAGRAERSSWAGR